MIDTLQAMLQQAGLATAAFPPTSRYHGIAIATSETTTGEQLAYVRRRLIPAPERFNLLQEHTVTEGERLDNIANQYLGDPQQFWRICDANAAMDPHELTDAIGYKIRITLPDGIPGYTHA